MKVLKFGGSSVATSENIQKVKSIVRSQDDAVVVVVSALGGVTDELIRIAALAESADASYLEKLQALKKRHVDACDELVDAGKGGKLLRLAVDSLLNELDSICR
ncbi:MAG: bifunctional aspartate kinase/homoserine dehydrogenase I, partial [Bacteroidales bacterium]|nr:bifunctional aspartate kinase/homoserine dehydrogenase I [Bacteroidales bacterium]